MKRNVLRIITILCTIVLVLSSCSYIFAASQPSDVGAGTGTGDFDDIGGKILGGIRTIGTIISVGVLMVLGIKYMMGSSEEKAEYKKTMIPYLIGAVLLFAAVNIANMIYTFAASAANGKP